MTHASLFSGIGGFDLAAQWMGWENLFHCEYNTFCQTVLKHYWPNATTYTDITTTDFTFWRGRVDILTGGFPCQPFSSAGKRAGTDDDRYLWPEMLRAIKEIRPKWIIGENVAGILTMERGETLRRICADLEHEGYEVECYDIPAYCAGLQTLERHIWIVAKATGQRFKRRKTYQHQDKGNERQFQRTNKGANQRWDICSTRFCDVAERVSNRLAPNQREEIKAGGNAIPPPVAFAIFQAIESNINTTPP